MLAISIETICRDLSPILKLVGEVLAMFKLALPLILITTTMIDMGKVLISSKPKDLMKCISNNFKRLIIFIAVLFVPTICMLTFGFVDEFVDIKNKTGIDFDVCYKCMFDSASSECEVAVKIAEQQDE